MFASNSVKKRLGKPGTGPNGAPMVGNAQAMAAFDKAFPEKIYRYVNDPDPVPKLPTVSLAANDYGHCTQPSVKPAM